METGVAREERMEDDDDDDVGVEADYEGVLHGAVSMTVMWLCTRIMWHSIIMM